MVTTRAQARAESGNGADTDSRPRCYESEDDSGSEAEGEDGDDVDEDEMTLVQIPDSAQVSGQNVTSTNPWVSVDTRDSLSSSSSPSPSLLAPSSSSDQLVEQLDDAHTTAIHGAITSRYQPPNQPTFFEQQHELGPPSYRELLQLEFYQTFPHDPTATLCKQHFLQLAERWFLRRQGQTEQTFHNIKEKFPYGGVEKFFEYMRDRDILKQVIWNEKWRQKRPEEFMETLRMGLRYAEIEQARQRRKAIVRTGKRPRCSLESCGKLSCGYCLARKNNNGDLYELVREATAEETHGEWREEDLAAFEEYKRRGVEEEGERADVQPEYTATMMTAEIKTHNEYTVGWVCALPKEQTAATAMLDQRHGDLPKPANDSNTYTLGSIGKHNVVIACLPKGHIGNSPAATVAAQMVSTFPSVRFGLMVGIGGGIPPKVRLGDVVVSTPVGSFPGVVQWDLGKAKDRGFERTGSLNNPPVSLLTALAKLETEHELVGSQIPEYLDQMKQKWPRLAAKYLKSDSLEDILFKANYSHVCQSTTEDHVSSGSSYESEEEESCQHCDKTKIIKRKPRDMRVHYGLIASGNQVIKSATRRDQLNKDLGGNLLCVEMEAAGLMNNFPCIVVRGICDYADSHKNKDWQEYAAAVAAAFAKELLAYVSPSDVDGERTVKDMMSDVLAEVSSTKAVVSNLKSTLDNEIDLRILEWVTPIDYGPQQSDCLRRREPGTCQWLIDSAEYQAWLGARKQTLFCPGIPGAGKTILTSIVVDHLERTYKTDPTVRIAYIYCNYRRQEEQSIEKLLASLLKQLSRGENCVSNCLRGFYKDHVNKRTQISLFEIQMALHSVAENYSTVFIVIDALDECQNLDGSRQKFITELFNLQEKCGWNLFMTSRAIPEIVDRCSKTNISLEIRASAEDIEIYLKGNTSQLPAFVQKNQELQQMIAAGISKAVDGMFQKPISGLGEAEKTVVLAHAYEQAMSRINGQQSGWKELAHNVLLWIVCAERQLTTTELQHALAVEIDELELDKENLPSIQDMVSACAGLVTVDYESNVIRLVHYTTQEYFNQTRKRWFPDADVIMADTCASYLLFKVFEEGAWRDLPYDVIRKDRLPVYGMTSLHLAACFGIEKTVRALLKEQIDVNVKDEKGSTPLSWSACNGHEAVVELLLAMPSIDIHTTGSDGNAPLYEAAENGYIAVVKLLLVAGANPNRGSSFGITPLMCAAENGYIAVVKLLLVAGANPNRGNSIGMTPLMCAAENGDVNVAEVLITAGADPNFKGELGEVNSTALLLAVGQGHEAVVKLLLASGAKVNLSNGHWSDKAALHIAAIEGHGVIVELLLAAGAIPDIRDNDGQTPLWHAAGKGYEAVVKSLIAAGADLNHRNKYDQTPLLHAVRRGVERGLELTLAAGKGPETWDGMTPEVFAIIREQHAVSELLLAAGADPDLGDGEGRTPLWYAADMGVSLFVKALVAAGADPDLGDEDDTTPLHIAAREGRGDTIKQLLAAGAKPDVRNKRGETPLSMAQERGHGAAAELLVDKGSEAESLTSWERTRKRKYKAID
ncbi:hypothetical protein THAR02_08530 [Trichoderma harzianum]|uniref:Uncharacterized protein n=1 Tax=Trichoderma harzianum TaxID=5544 RepID=A0A0F9XFF7_TRIHA|nr:hypothetical protein THAR02_08530 [Trichoderma harzianum]